MNDLISLFPNSSVMRGQSMQLDMQPRTLSAVGAPRHLYDFETRRYQKMTRSLEKVNSPRKRPYSKTAEYAAVSRQKMMEEFLYEEKDPNKMAPEQLITKYQQDLHHLNQTIQVLKRGPAQLVHFSFLFPTLYSLALSSALLAYSCDDWGFTMLIIADIAVLTVPCCGLLARRYTVFSEVRCKIILLILIVLVFALQILFAITLYSQIWCGVLVCHPLCDGRWLSEQILVDFDVCPADILGYVRLHIQQYCRLKNIDAYLDSLHILQKQFYLGSMTAVPICTFLYSVLLLYNLIRTLKWKMRKIALQTKLESLIDECSQSKEF